MPNIQQRYKNEVVPTLIKEFNYTTVMQAPRVQKIVLNIGAGGALDNPKILDGAVADLQLITGQKPVLTAARKSIANFKLREGRQIGVKVTLRGARMWAFLDRLCNVALPRIRDFRGIPSKGFDGRGNFTLGLKEQLVFPEINYDQIDQVWGMDIVVCTTARTDDEARALLKEFDFPFRN